MIGEETGEEDLSTLISINQIEENTSHIVKQQIEDCIKKVQEYNTDIFGFGVLVHRKYSKDWKEIKNQWNDIFSSYPWQTYRENSKFYVFCLFNI